MFSERGNEDKSFLVKGKALGERRGVVEATGELLLLSTANPLAKPSSPLLSNHPFSPSPRFNSRFFSTALLLLCWSIGCCLLYKYIATSSHFWGGRNTLSLWTYTFSIRYGRLVCSFQYESLNDDPLWRQPPRKGNNKARQLWWSNILEIFLRYLCFPRNPIHFVRIIYDNILKEWILFDN